MIQGHAQKQGAERMGMVNGLASQNGTIIYKSKMLYNRTQVSNLRTKLKNFLSMKKIIIIATIIILILLVLYFAFILRISAEKSCFENSYRNAHDGGEGPVVDRKLLNKNFNECVKKWSPLTHYTIKK